MAVRAVLLLPTLAAAFLPGLEPSARDIGGATRRAFFADCGRAIAVAAVAAAAGAMPSPAVADKSRGYMTMEEYNKLKAQQLKDEKLYGKFETLRSRASQTSEFDRLVSFRCVAARCSVAPHSHRVSHGQADSSDFNKLSELSRGWENSVRKELMETVAKELEGETKSKAAEISKIVLADLKSIDKLVSCLRPF
jgi:hypothetical protein